MKHYGPIGRREQPCPDDSVSLEEAIQGQLEELDEKTVASFIAYCDDRIDEFLEHEANRRRNKAEQIEQSKQEAA
jgi:hypothetical protein